MKMPAAARNSISPFPVSPSGGKPGRAGSPHAGSTLRGQQKALARIMRRLPPQEGCRPLVNPLRARYAGFGNLRDARGSQGYNCRPPSAKRCWGVYTKYLTLPRMRAAASPVFVPLTRCLTWGLLEIPYSLKVSLDSPGHSKSLTIREWFFAGGASLNRIGSLFAG